MWGSGPRTFDLHARAGDGISAIDDGCGATLTSFTIRDSGGEVLGESEPSPLSYKTPSGDALALANGHSVAFANDSSIDRRFGDMVEVEVRVVDGRGRTAIDTREVCAAPDPAFDSLDAPGCP